MVNILGPMGCSVSLTATQVCSRNAKATMDNLSTTGHGWVPMKLKGFRTSLLEMCHVGIWVSLS